MKLFSYVMQGQAEEKRLLPRPYRGRLYQQLAYITHGPSFHVRWKCALIPPEQWLPPLPFGMKFPVGDFSGCDVVIGRYVCTFLCTRHISWPNSSPVVQVTRASPPIWWVACQNLHVELHRKLMMETGLHLTETCSLRLFFGVIHTLLPHCMISLGFRSAKGTEVENTGAGGHVTLWAGTVCFLFWHVVSPGGF